MAKAVYETVCPSCSKPFEIEETAAEGRCPHCNAYLKFIPDEPAPEAPTPEPTPEATLAPGDAASADVPEPLVGEFRLECLACHGALNVASDATGATCPHCAAVMTLEDAFAERGVEFPVECPSCNQLHEVPIDSTKGACPHCGANLEYEDVLAGAPPAGTSEPSTPAPAATAAAAPEPAAPAEPPARRVTIPTHEAPTPEPVGANGPLARTEPYGIPVSVDCPSCKKSFGIPEGAIEGNCPHCNVPLAFVSEKEFEQLLVAEERKKQMQQKLAEKRQRLKEQGLGKKATTPDQAAAAERKGLFPWKRKRETEPPARPAPESKPPKAATPPEPATVAVVEAPTQVAPTTKAKKEKPAPAPPAAVVVEEASLEIADAPPEAPVKKQRFGFLQRSKEPAAPSAPASVELAAVDFTSDAAPAMVVAKPKKEKAAKPAPAAVATEEISISSEPAVTIDVGEASPAAPAVARKGLFGRFRKEKAAEAPAAAVEAAEISFGAAAETAPPAAKPSKKKAKEAPPAAVVEEAGISFGETVEAVAAPPKKSKGKSAPAAVEDGGISFGETEIAAPAKSPKKAKEAPPAAVIDMGEIVMESGPSEPEISIDMGDPSEAPAKKSRRR